MMSLAHKPSSCSVPFSTTTGLSVTNTQTACSVLRSTTRAQAELRLGCAHARLSRAHQNTKNLGMLVLASLKRESPPDFSTL